MASLNSSNAPSEPHSPAILSSAPGRSAAGRDRFVRACAGEVLDIPPVWLMRQAGRALPEYRALREKHSFVELVQTPDLASEVTLQPIRRFGFDAAILFSDILVICEGLGQRYSFRDGGGVQMEFTIRDSSDISRLRTEGVTERLAYTGAALRTVRTELGGRTGLIGFAGSPWTLANFMLEGGSSKDFQKAKLLLIEDSKAFGALCQKLTDAVTEFLRLQIDSGVDAVQIFDSVGGMLSPGHYEAASGRWIREIVARLGNRVPVIVFAKGAHGSLDQLEASGGQVLGFDWTVSLAEIRRRLKGRVGLQGNLDPALLTTTPEAVTAEVRRILRETEGHEGFIFNLGHGLPPGSKLENIEALVRAVRAGVNAPEGVERPLSATT